MRLGRRGFAITAGDCTDRIQDWVGERVGFACPATGVQQRTTSQRRKRRLLVGRAGGRRVQRLDPVDRTGDAAVPIAKAHRHVGECRRGGLGLFAHGDPAAQLLELLRQRGERVLVTPTGALDIVSELRAYLVGHAFLLVHRGGVLLAQLLILLGQAPGLIDHLRDLGRERAHRVGGRVDVRCCGRGQVGHQVRLGSALAALDRDGHGDHQHDAADDRNDPVHRDHRTTSACFGTNGARAASRRRSATR